MSTFAPLYHLLDEEQKRISWRLDWLERLGFGPIAASVLARDRTIDLHELDKLIGRGCPHDVAVRILR
jgi:hypothetical protein